MQPRDLELNANAQQFAEFLLDQAPTLRIAAENCAETSATLIDCGIKVPGGLEAGRGLAEICMSTLGDIRIVPARAEFGGGPAVQVQTDQPVTACIASQYAGWKLAEGKYFAMGSGPMRLAAAKEPLFQKLKWEREETEEVVGVLETREMPPPEVVAKIAAECQVEPENVTLLLAPTASLAGSVQIVARSVETALHKLLELEFDLTRVVSAYGLAPLPPPGKNDLVAIGRTNDAILYGGEVTLYVDCSDALIAEIGPRVPSCASDDFGRPFQEIFEHYGGDFYQIDPHLFSPAAVTFCNVKTGKTFRYGEIRPELIRKSWG